MATKKKIKKKKSPVKKKRPYKKSTNGRKKKKRGKKAKSYVPIYFKTSELGDALAALKAGGFTGDIQLQA